MKNSISKKLTIANALILTASLLILGFLISTIYRSNMYKNIGQQLVVENRMANKLYTNNIKETSLYKILSNSINLVYERDDKNNSLQLVYTSDKNFDMDVEIRDLLSEYIHNQSSSTSVKINGEEYLYSISTIKDGDQQVNSIIVSLISTKSVQSVTRKFYTALILCLIILAIISIGITLLLSNRITKPIKRLTKLTEQYASRNFDKKYIANTNDEVQLLSESINTMADNLQAHDKEKARVYRNISHELKTPLTAIYGYAEGIKTGVFTNTDEPLDIIMSESLRIKKYAENIILLSKLESNIEIFKFAEYNISQIIENAIKGIESMAILNDIDIHYIPMKLEKIKIDDEKIFIALNNILSNCIKYTKDNINISLMQDKEYIQIEISDNGKGFDSEAIENIISGKTYEKSNGSGIGLSIVKEIISKHNGEFTIGNLHDGGAVFAIKLPK